MKEILVSNDGYEQFFLELEKLKDSITSNALISTEACNDAVGDGWHDNFAYDEAMRQERFIVSKVNDMINDIPFLKVIDDIFDSDKININDTIEVLIKYADDDDEKEILKLTGKYSPNTNDVNGVKEISLNSPIGKAIYKQKIGESVYYEVGNNNIEVSILKKINN